MNTKAGAQAFTRIELITIIGVLLFMALVATPAAKSTPASARAVQCMANLRQLNLAWLAYASDFNGQLVHNYHGGAAQGGAIVSSNPQAAPWACGWIDWATGNDNTNAQLVLNSKYAKLTPYLPEVDARLFRCPEDTYVSKAQKSRGWLSRVRSYSMSASVGFGNQETGPWVPSLYKVAKKLEDIRDPAKTFTFLDEHPDSINDPLFWLPDNTRFIDLPGNLHDGAGGFGFAAGHAEIHKWESSLRGFPVKVTAFGGLTAPANSPDLVWLRSGGVPAK